MAMLSDEQVLELKGKLSSDPSTLGKIYKSKKKKFHERNVDHNRVEEFLRDGWEEFGTRLKTKTKLRKPKSHSDQFEDDIWCQMYELGFRQLNVDRHLSLPFGRNETERKQIDVLAVSGDVVLIIECKSSDKAKKAPSFKTEFEALSQRLDGHKKVIEQLFGPGKRMKFIFATRNLRLNRASVDVQRLEECGGYFFNDNTFDYVNSLIKAYKDASHYQFLGMVFKGQNINSEKIEVPAIEGRMGAKTYYMFSLEPELLLKLGFVLHRTRANEAEMPTYQRLLVPNRLKGIGKFIEEGGYFPNSVIINFNEKKRQKIQFEANSRSSHSKSRSGTLKIPNAYAIAYIIDGQHRVYGYSQSKFKSTNTIPVVAFKNLESSEQLEMFMDINQNQKAVSPTLRITLEEDLFWDAARADSRMKALRSSIISSLGGDQSGPLFGKISLGEDRATLQAKPFADSLLRSGLLPEAKGNKFTAKGANLSLYDVQNQDHRKEMRAAKQRIVSLLNHSYELAETMLSSQEEVLSDFIVSNKGTYAFISLIGSVYTHECKTASISLNVSDEDRFSRIEKYLTALFDALKNLDKELSNHLLGIHGSGAETAWLRNFQNILNRKFSDYDPPELEDWRERQNQELQQKGRELGTSIERHLKKTILSNLKLIFGDNWELEIASIKRECLHRASEQEERNYKEGLEVVKIEWTEQFMLKDYKKIISDYWVKKPDPAPEGFLTFEDHYAIDIGQGFKTKNDKLKWFSQFNSLRNLWAHEGSKDKGLNMKEVEFLDSVHSSLKAL
ncbi:DGQHR domain-containing protein [Ruegeria arenilitoris]|uniref:DGQHR domain-containing protein n=1 Tax=Ruegeria arenilitoris TaxID=1173585 RepID=UPI00147A3745|nr:DGQHR domain-containing protein [Ruegeria arenilitoris]